MQGCSQGPAAAPTLLSWLEGCGRQGARPPLSWYPQGGACPLRGAASYPGLGNDYLSPCSQSSCMIGAGAQLPVSLDQAGVRPGTPRVLAPNPHLGPEQSKWLAAPDSQLQQPYPSNSLYPPAQRSPYGPQLLQRLLEPLPEEQYLGSAARTPLPCLQQLPHRCTCVCVCTHT